MNITIKTALLSTAVALGTVSFGWAQTSTDTDPNVDPVTTEEATESNITEKPAIVEGGEVSVITVENEEMTEEELAKLNGVGTSTDSPAPGPYIGWMVVSKDNMPLGTVTKTDQDDDDRITTVAFEMEDGKVVTISNGIAAITDNQIMLRVDQANILTKATAQSTVIEIK